ncbi:uncharacterized protein PRD47_009353 [Ara ararauna]
MGPHGFRLPAAQQWRLLSHENEIQRVSRNSGGTETLLLLTVPCAMLHCQAGTGLLAVDLDQESAGPAEPAEIPTTLLETMDTGGVGFAAQQGGPDSGPPRWARGLLCVGSTMLATVHAITPRLRWESQMPVPAPKATGRAARAVMSRGDFHKVRRWDPAAPPAGRHLQRCPAAGAGGVGPRTETKERSRPEGAQRSRRSPGPPLRRDAAAEPPASLRPAAPGPAPLPLPGGIRGGGSSSHAQLPLRSRSGSGSNHNAPGPRCTYPAAAAPREELAWSCRACGGRAAGPLLFFTALSSSLPPSLPPLFPPSFLPSFLPPGAAAGGAVPAPRRGSRGGAGQGPRTSLPAACPPPPLHAGAGNRELPASAPGSSRAGRGRLGAEGENGGPGPHRHPAKVSHQGQGELLHGHRGAIRAVGSCTAACPKRGTPGWSGLYPADLCADGASASSPGSLLTAGLCSWGNVTPCICSEPPWSQLSSFHYLGNVAPSSLHDHPAGIGGLLLLILSQNWLQGQHLSSQIPELCFSPTQELRVGLPHGMAIHRGEPYRVNFQLDQELARVHGQGTRESRAAPSSISSGICFHSEHHYGHIET